jgi:hypothetical protein
MELKERMETTAKMLGLELDEEFTVNKGVLTGDTFKFTDAGFMYNHNSTEWHTDAAFALSQIIHDPSLIIKKPWVPKIGDRYYFPCINACKIDSFVYSNHKIDKIFINLGLASKSAEEAQDKLTTLIIFCKNEFK